MFDGRECGAELEVADELHQLCEKEMDLKGERINLKHRIARLTDRPFPSLLMTLLASLRTKATITQNYDKHAETALMNVNIRQPEGKVRMGM